MCKSRSTASKGALLHAGAPRQAQGGGSQGWSRPVFPSVWSPRCRMQSAACTALGGHAAGREEGRKEGGGMLSEVVGAAPSGQDHEMGPRRGM